jgi:hypothetical protein
VSHPIQATSTSEIDRLLWYWHKCTDEDECLRAWKDVLRYLADNWILLVEWSQFEAFGKYFVSPDRKRCINIGRNLRTDPVTRWIDEVTFKDPEELANKIWSREKGVIPFKKIRERIKEVFGVDVEMSAENRLIRTWFGEAGD